MPHCARVAIDGSPDLEFDYEIPEEMRSQVAVGSRVSVPLRSRKAKGTVLLVFEDDKERRGLREISTLIHPHPILTDPLLRLADWIANYYACSRESVLRAMLPDSVRAEALPFLNRKAVRLIKEIQSEDIEALRRRAPRQAEVLEQLHTSQKPILLTKLNQAAVKGLVKNEWVVLEEQSVQRDPHGTEEFLANAPIQLSAQQQEALRVVLQAVEDPSKQKPILLHGVTGSGKTEVYLQAVASVLEADKSALVLVPEISLTPQTVERFKSRFAHLQKSVAVLHSHLSQGERFDEWYKIHRGEARIVIGARSAIFAPLDRLGLIVVDEEHESSYKQDSTPRYHGRDVAVVRAKFENCAILLGSATPSLESYQNTRRGKYTYVALTERVDDRAMPLVRVVDMRLESRKQKKGPPILSDILRRSIEQRIERGEQVILFLNRRGFANTMQCLECGYVCGCQHCSLSLTYHQAEQRLICHMCGYKQIAPRRCPSCKSESIRFSGFGTERAEEVVRKVFPKLRMARIDADVMQRKHLLAQTLRAFQTRKLDLLVGTQMIAKGLDFPNVTLVGILNADLGLHIPDFRAGERTFNLLTQVAGRAGRGELAGEVVVQTFTPQSPSIQFARHHDFEGFSNQELEMREQFHYPPFTHACLIHVRSTNERLAEFTLENLSLRLRRDLPQGIEMGAPVPSPLQKAADFYRFQVMLRASTSAQMTKHIRHVMSKMTFPEDVVVIIDVDPYQLG